MNIPIGFLLIFVLLASCGLPFGQDNKRRPGNRIHSSSNPVFHSYTQSFEEKAKSELGNPSFKVGDVPVNFGDTEDPSYDGVCLTYPNGEKEIIIKKSWWDSRDAKSREALIYHEFGHCVLNRSEHTNDLDPVTKVPLSIMNSKVPQTRYYNDYLDEYHKELFNRDTQALGLKLKQGEVFL